MSYGVTEIGVGVIEVIHVSLDSTLIFVLALLPKQEV